jgi:hypothetical protein
MAVRPSRAAPLSASAHQVPRRSGARLPFAADVRTGCPERRHFLGTFAIDHAAPRKGELGIHARDGEHSIARRATRQVAQALTDTATHQLPRARP